MFRQSLRIRRLLPCLLISVLAACGGRSPQPSQDGLAVVDALGRGVRLPGAPRRVVSLAPEVTEIVFALGRGGGLVGVSDQCDHPARAAGLPKVGPYTGPALEAVVGLRPDLAIATTSGNPPWLPDRLAGSGVPTAVVDPTSLAGIAAAIRLTGGLLDAVAEADRLARPIEQVAAAPFSAGGPVCLLLYSLDPPMAAAPETLGGELLARAGCENRLPPGGPRYPVLGREGLYAAGADLIFIAAGSEVETERFRRAWPDLPAVQAGRVRRIEPDLVSRGGPRVLEGLSRLREALGGSDAAGGL